MDFFFPPVNRIAVDSLVITGVMFQKIAANTELLILNHCATGIDSCFFTKGVQLEFTDKESGHLEDR